MIVYFGTIHTEWIGNWAFYIHMKNTHVEWFPTRSGASEWKYEYYNYHNVLTFGESGFTCSDCGPRINQIYDYSGALFDPISSSNASQLVATNWVITSYDEGTHYLTQ
jgi:hypothetical protein